MSSTPHDALVRAILGQTEHAVGILRGLVPAGVADRADWSQLRLQSGSYVDSELRATESDLLFRLPVAGHQAFLYLLLEHQSTPDARLAFRLLRYQVRIWHRWTRDHPQSLLPPVIPLVIYHGRHPWPFGVELSDGFQLSSTIRRSIDDHLLKQEFVLCDLTEVEDRILHGWAASAVARLMLIALKHAPHSVDLVDRLAAAAKLWRVATQSEAGGGFTRQIFRYIYLVNNHLEPHVLRDSLIRHVDQKTGDIAMSVGQRLIEQGLVQGREEGREEGMLAGQRQLLLRVLNQRFGDLSDEHKHKIANATQQSLIQWTDRLLHSQSVTEVLDD